MAVFIQLIEVWRATTAGAGVLAVQQGCRRQQGIGIDVPQQGVELKAQQP